jgi:hypothetical protein
MVVEKVYLSLPELATNLILENAKKMKMTKDLYDKHGEFKGHEDVVRIVLEETEFANPTKTHQELFEMLPPKVKKRLETMGKLNMTDVNPDPSRKIDMVEPPKDPDHGVL